MRRIILFLLILSLQLFAAIGKITYLKGAASVERNGQMLPASTNMQLEEKDRLSTNPESVARVHFDDGTLISIGQESVLNIEDYLFDEANTQNSQAKFNFASGSFKTLTGQIGKIAPDRFKMSTSTVTIGIRGTIVLGNQEQVACTQGSIAVTAQGVTQLVPAGMITTTRPGEPPTPPRAITTDDLGEMESATGGGEDGEEPQEEETGEAESAPVATAGDDGPIDTTPVNIDDEVNEISDEVTEDEGEKVVEEQIEEEEDSGARSSYSKTFSGRWIDGFVYTVEDATDEINWYGIGTNSGVVASGYTFTNDDEYFSVSSTELIYPVAGGYDSSSLISLGTTTHTFTNEGTDYLATQTMVSDNMGEFIVGTVDQTFTIDGKEYVFNSISYAGDPSDMSNLDTSKIYVYDLYASMFIDKLYGTDPVYDDSQFYLSSASDEEISIYVNAGTMSGTIHYKNFYTVGAKYFRSTSIASDGSGSSVEYGIENIVYSDVSQTELGYATSTGQIYGTDLQGFGSYGTWAAYDNYGLAGQSSTISDNSVAASYLSGTEEITNSTGTNTLSGFGTVVGVSDSANFFSPIDITQVITSSDFSASGYVGDSGGSDYFTISGNTDAQSAYYIHDDLWGVLLDSYVNVYSESLTKGWMVAVPDDLDSDGNPIASDDSSSWGYWTVIINDGSDETGLHSPFSTWVAGEETASSVISSLMSNSATGTFNGHVIGAVTDSGVTTVDSIAFDSNNYANFTIDYGSADITGSMGFNTVGGNSWSATINSGSVTSSGFSSTDISGTGNSNTISSGELNGKFYGSSSVESIGGNFKLQTSSETAIGVFKAK